LDTRDDLAWARTLRLQLNAEIGALKARAREGRHAELLGLLPDRDRLADLERRLTQVDRLIGAIDETNPEVETGWPAHLGDPTEAPQPPHRHSR